MEERTNKSRVVGLAEAAALLDLSDEAVRSLVAAGYLTAGAGNGDAGFVLGDLKAFVARNADDGTGLVWDGDAGGVDPLALLDALDGRSEEMAQRAYSNYCLAYSDAVGWTLAEQARFIEQARKRFEAILAVTGQGQEVDDALVDDLKEVGASAAWAGSSLPQLLVILRISRDLVVQTAVEVAEERGRHWGLALSLLLNRVLPAMDRLTDSVAQGYWAAVLSRQKESRARYEAVVEDSSDGMFELDLDGRVQYANRSFAVITGYTPEELDDAPLLELLRPVEPGDALQQLMAGSREGPQRLELIVPRADGVRRVLEVRTQPRYEHDEVVGLQGAVRDITTAHDLDEAKNEFLALITNDLRMPLASILGLGATLESHAPELAEDQILRMGSSIRHQCERIARLADDIHDVSRIESRSLVLHLRAVELAPIVEMSLPAVASYTPGVDVHVQPGIQVVADPRRLEQVVANLVENAIVHGDAPVVVEAMADGRGWVDVSIRDHGPGVPEALAPTLFSQVRSFARHEHHRGRGTGLGLALTRGLVEAMGGRVSYEPAEGGGACFHVVLPSPHVRSSD